MLRNFLLFLYKEDAYEEEGEHTTLPGFAETIAANKNTALTMLMRRY